MIRPDTPKYVPLELFGLKGKVTLTFALAHLDQTVIDDAGAEAEAHQGDRPHSMLSG